MDTINNVIRRIEDGFVINEHGRWLYMAEQRIYEKRVIEQIVNGNVLIDGKWVAIGYAKRLAQRDTAAPHKPPTLMQSPPAPVTLLVPQQPAETTSFEAVGDMMETICMDMTSVMSPPEETAEDARTPPPSHIDSVMISGLSGGSADQSRYAIAYIDELNQSRKRGGLFGKLAKLSIAAAAIAAAVLLFMRYMG